MELHAGQFLKDSFIRDFQSDNLLWNDVQFAKHGDLLQVERASIKDPAVQAAVGLAKSFVDKFDNFVIRHDTILCEVALQSSCVIVISVASANFHDKLLYLNVDELILLSNLEGVLLFLGARGAHQDDALRTAWCISLLVFEDAVDLFNNAHLLVVAIKLGYEALADAFDSLDLQVVLKDGVARDFSNLCWVIDPSNSWLTVTTAEIPRNSF